MEVILALVKKIIPRKLFKSLQPIYHYLWSFLGALRYGFPANKLIVIAVTGTTGKTSSVYLIAKTLENLGQKVGYTSTAMFSDGEKEWLNNKKMTMPGRLFTQSMLSRMVKNSCRFAVIEVTSEGIRQFRHLFINYDVLVFTGLYPEHIESHGSFENYRNAKGKLFAYLKKCRTKYINEDHLVVTPKTELQKLNLKRLKKTSIINLEDEQADYFLNFWAENKIAYAPAELLSAKFLEDLKLSGWSNLSLIKYEDIKAQASGTSFTVTLGDQPKEDINLKLLGDFNALNALTAIIVSTTLDFNLAKIKLAVEKIPSIVGRLEKVELGQDFTALIDYAFEPKALGRLYDNLKLIPHNKLIHVLGSAGGGRDKARRPLLGALAGKQADIAIVTNEDPYDEDPWQIIEAVAEGAEDQGKVLNKDLFKILDRREAIAKAVNLAKTGDLLLVTGKGSEQFICLKNGVKEPWDERQVLSEEIRRTCG